MDWPAVARLLADDSALPIAMVDDAGTIRLFNRAMEHVFGWSRFEAEGRAWSEVCVAADHVTEVERWISEAMRGALSAYETIALTKTGDRVACGFQFSLVGHGAEQALLITLTSAVPEVPSPGSAARDLDYEIWGVGPEFGKLSKLSFDGKLLPMAGGERRCFSMLYELEQPCEDCPLLGEGRHWPRTLIRQRTSRSGESSGATFEITTAERINETVVRLRVRNLSDETLAAIHRVKLDRIAQRARLSQRERDVLTHLLMGRSIEDIALILDISPRTVKYHQGNVLSKVGADSRLDLLRLMT